MPLKSLRRCVAFAALSMIGSTAGADAIQSYAVTNLGLASSPPYSGELTANFSAPTGDNATVTAQDGTVYAFPRTDNRVTDLSPFLAKLPPLPGRSNERPGDVFQEYRTTDFLNKNGIAAVLVEGGLVRRGLPYYGPELFQKQPDGNFAAISPSWHENGNHTGSTNTFSKIFDLNNKNEMLSIGSTPYDDRLFMLTNINTGINTNLQSILPGWHIDFGHLALDDQGRIVVYGEPPYSSDSPVHDYNDYALLLTPAGLSSAPRATPEPSTFVTLAVAGLCVLARQRWRMQGDRAVSKDR